jgi:N-acetylmuramoyl-L-alanine amidase
VAAYSSISEILGHQEIAAGRKFDPGPAFPLQRFRDLLDNRGIGAIEDESDDRERSPERYVSTTRLNIRGGPGVEFERLDESPLAPGTILEYLDHKGVWTNKKYQGVRSLETHQSKKLFQEICPLERLP